MRLTGELVSSQIKKLLLWQNLYQRRKSVNYFTSFSSPPSWSSQTCLPMGLLSTLASRSSPKENRIPFRQSTPPLPGEPSPTIPTAPSASRGSSPEEEEDVELNTTYSYIQNVYIFESDTMCGEENVPSPRSTAVVSATGRRTWP